MSWSAWHELNAAFSMHVDPAQGLEHASGGDGGGGGGGSGGGEGAGTMQTPVERSALTSSGIPKVACSCSMTSESLSAICRPLRCTTRLTWIV